MDLSDARTREIFFDIHSGLPREAPGLPECTRQALGLARPLPRVPQVLDIACGPGMQTMDLAAALPGARIAALDRHLPFLIDANRRAAAADVADRVRCVVGDMNALPFPDGMFDLIWCEGAAYIMGVPAALRAWRPLLKQGGTLALTDTVWLHPDPPAAVRKFWTGYPDMTDVAGCRAIVHDCGYALRGDFVLPERAWWEHYYNPKLARIDQLRGKYRGDAIAEALLEEAREETEVYRDHAAYYGYAFFVMTRAG